MTARWTSWSGRWGRSASPAPAALRTRVDNLFARRGAGGPHFCYAGHTDVVPPGDAGWRDDPFAGVVRDGMLFGRGACDMKGGIAAFVAGLADFIAANPNHPGSVSLLITGDEEGAAWTAPPGCWSGWQPTARSRTWRWSASRPRAAPPRRHGQDRPPRQPERLDHAARHAGPQRLPAARRQPDPPAGARAAPPDRRRSTTAARISSPRPCRSPASTSATPRATSSPPRRGRCSTSASTTTTPARADRDAARRLARGGRPLRPAHRMLRRELPDPARPLRRWARRAPSARHRRDAGARHRRRHIGRPLHRALCPVAEFGAVGDHRTRWMSGPGGGAPPLAALTAPCSRSSWPERPTAHRPRRRRPIAAAPEVSRPGCAAPSGWRGARRMGRADRGHARGRRPHLLGGRHLPARLPGAELLAGRTTARLRASPMRSWRS